MMKLLGLSLLLAGAATSAFASITVPEIDGGSAVSALVLLSGGLLVLRTGRKK
jgi:hypothetical protein